MKSAAAGPALCSSLLLLQVLCLVLGEKSEGWDSLRRQLADQRMKLLLKKQRDQLSTTASAGHHHIHLRNTPSTIAPDNNEDPSMTDQEREASLRTLYHLSFPSKMLDEAHGYKKMHRLEEFADFDYHPTVPTKKPIIQSSTTVKLKASSHRKPDNNNYDLKALNHIPGLAVGFLGAISTRPKTQQKVALPFLEWLLKTQQKLKGQPITATAVDDSAEIDFRIPDIPIFNLLNFTTGLFYGNKEMAKTADADEGSRPRTARMAPIMNTELQHQHFSGRSVRLEDPSGSRKARSSISQDKKNPDQGQKHKTGLTTTKSSEKKEKPKEVDPGLQEKMKRIKNLAEAIMEEESSGPLLPGQIGEMLSKLNRNYNNKKGPDTRSIKHKTGRQATEVQKAPESKSTYVTDSKKVARISATAMTKEPTTEGADSEEGSEEESDEDVETTTKERLPAKPATTAAGSQHKQQPKAEESTRKVSVTKSPIAGNSAEVTTNVQKQRSNQRISINNHIWMPSGNAVSKNVERGTKKKKNLKLLQLVEVNPDAAKKIDLAHLEYVLNNMRRQAGLSPVRINTEPIHIQHDGTLSRATKERVLESLRKVKEASGEVKHAGMARKVEHVLHDFVGAIRNISAIVAVATTAMPTPMPTAVAKIKTTQATSTTTTTEATTTMLLRKLITTTSPTTTTTTTTTRPTTTTTKPTTTTTKPTTTTTTQTPATRALTRKTTTTPLTTTTTSTTVTTQPVNEWIAVLGNTEPDGSKDPGAANLDHMHPTVPAVRTTTENILLDTVAVAVVAKRIEQLAHQASRLVDSIKAKQQVLEDVGRIVVVDPARSYVDSLIPTHRHTTRRSKTKNAKVSRVTDYEEFSASRSGSREHSSAERMGSSRELLHSHTARPPKRPKKTKAKKTKKKGSSRKNKQEKTIKSKKRKHRKRRPAPAVTSKTIAAVMLDDIDDNWPMDDWNYPLRKKRAFPHPDREISIDESMSNVLQNIKDVEAVLVRAKKGGRMTTTTTMATTSGTKTERPSTTPTTTQPATILATAQVTSQQKTTKK